MPHSTKSTSYQEYEEIQWLLARAVPSALESQISRQMEDVYIHWDGELQIQGLDPQQLLGPFTGCELDLKEMAAKAVLSVRGRNKDKLTERVSEGLAAMRNRGIKPEELWLWDGHRTVLGDDTVLYGVNVYYHRYRSPEFVAAPSRGAMETIPKEKQ